MIHRPLILPFYHLISDDNLPHIKHLYPVKNVDQFKRELDFFQTHYTSISLKELIAKKEFDFGFEKPVFHLSFDDGLKQCKSIIAPILKERGLDATFFINPNFIGDRDLFYRYKVGLIIEKIAAKKNDLLKATIHQVDELNLLGDKLNIDFKNKEIYLTTNEIYDLISLGFTIGAHSMNHPYYEDISLEEQILETNNSIHYIRDNFNLSYRVFSFPFTDSGVKKETFNAMDVDLSFGTAGIKDDTLPFHLQRLPMDNCLGNPSVFIHKHLLKFSIQFLFNKHKVTH